MSTKARQIVIDTFEVWIETLPDDDTTEILEKVRDIILYRLEKETIEMSPEQLSLFPEQRSGGREIHPEELISFEDEKSEQLSLDALEGELDRGPSST